MIRHWGTRHVPSPQLALLARGDLTIWDRWLVERHVERCDTCASVVHEFMRMEEEISAAATELPPQLSGAAWQSLASEMTANIRLGIAAGECVSVRAARAGRPRLTLALAGLAVLVVLAGLEHADIWNGSPSLQPPVEADSGLRTLEASGSEIAVRGAGNVLAVPAPAGREVIRTVNTRGQMRSRFVDDTGVTIVDVYAYAE